MKFLQKLNLHILHIIIICFFSIYSSSIAQPVISYIIPDIGSPGMNTYFEIIGHTNSNGNFGSDGFYLNNPNDNVRCEVLNKQDSTKLVFGPLVVSWNGRMISCQAFVNPIITPNSSDWSLLNQQYRIPIRVYVNGKGYSNVDTFYIVQPQHLGDVSSINENILGEGQLGKRSRRGAMLIDSLILGDKTYKISVLDCDPLIDGSRGNQGYLPVTILVKNFVSGKTNTKISLDGGSPKRQDAGPGGGGGGGRFYDATLLGSTTGDDGGDGFVGGGPGGRNNSGIPGQQNSFKNWGNGSDSAGYSLNGVKPPEKGQYEASGGATGHPFGLSGLPCNDGNNCAPNGGFGGGSGNKQTHSGGSAGYAENGEGYLTSGGQRNGNSMIVPIAGGSGGASGNPQGAGTFSGSGGGGGGALSIFANEISNVNFSANGANGGLDNGDGGNGSGGALLIYSKVNFENSTLQVNGGTTPLYKGSIGRIRLDYKNYSNVVPSTMGANPWIGFTTDSNKLVPRKFVLSGRKPNGKSIKLYLKSESTNWQLIANITNPASIWSTQIILPSPDSIFYLTATMDIDNPNTSTYEQEPTTILSQAAANIFIIDKLPHLVCDSVLNMRYYNCENFPKTFSTRLYNTGDTSLQVQFQNEYFVKNDQGFQIISPKGYKIIKPLDSVDIIFQFTPPNNKTKFFTDTLVFLHNDNFSTNPWKIALNVQLDTVLLALQNMNDIKQITSSYHGLDTIDFGKICVGDNFSIDYLLQNYSSNYVSINDLKFIKNYFSAKVNNNMMDYNEPTNQQNITFTLLNTNTFGWIYDTLEIKIDECSSYSKKIPVKIFVERVTLKISGNSNFGKIDISSKKTNTFKIVNQGSKEAFINDLTSLFLIKNAEFKIININPALPVLLTPFQDTIFVEIEFTPSGEGLFTDSLIVKSNAETNSCPDSESMYLTATGVSSKIEVSSDLLDYGLTSECADIEKTVYIKNLPEATSDLIITKAANIIGIDQANFNISQEPFPLPYTIKPGDSVVYYIRYIANAGGAGNKNAQIEIYTDSPSEPVITIDLTAEREDINLSFSPFPTIDFGDVYAGFDYTKTVSSTNLGRIARYVFDIITDNTDLSAFPIGGWLNTNPSNQIDFDFTLNAKTEGQQTINAKFIITDPCRDTISMKFTANVIFSSYKLPDKIDFGVLSSCEFKTDTIKIENISNAPYVITEMSQIQGADSSLFKIQNYPKRLPDTLYPGESRKIVVTFNPQSSVDGSKSAYVEFTVYINGKFETKKIMLLGVRESGILFTPTSLNFDDVIVNTSKILNLKIENKGPWTINIISISLPFVFPLNYTFTDISPTILNSGEFRDLPITFLPTNLIDYNDSILIKFQIGTCPIDSIYIQLNGKGVPAKNIKIWLPNISTTPDQDNFEIPIYGKLEKAGDNLQGFILDTLIISFDRSIFYPTSVNGSNSIILKNVLEQNNRKLYISLRNINLNDNDSLIAKVIGYTMLGSTDTTTLFIDTIMYSQVNIVTKIEKQNGFLQIETCQKGAKRLLTFANNPLIGIINPNPNFGSFDIEFNLIESGKYILKISDLNGKEITLDEFYINKGNDKKYNKHFEVSNILSLGYYRVVLITPSEIFTYPLMLIK